MRPRAEEKIILQRGEAIIQRWEGLRGYSQTVMNQSLQYENAMKQVIAGCVQMAHGVKKTHDDLKSEMMELTQYLDSLKAQKAGKRPAKKARKKA
jgi:hypothetical protein